MNTLVIVPVRGTTGSKSRLARLFDDHQRMQLMWTMARHVVAQVPSRVDLAVITRNVPGVELQIPGVRVIEQAPDAVGLNGSLQQALRLAQAERYRDMLMLPADLPLVSSQEIELLLLEEGDIVIGGDRDQNGTNSIRVPTRLAGRFRFGMGQGSFHHHLAESRSLGMIPLTVYQPGLAHDLDTPDDWRSLPAQSRAWLTNSMQTTFQEAE